MEISDYLGPNGVQITFIGVPEAEVDEILAILNATSNNCSVEATFESIREICIRYGVIFSAIPHENGGIGGAIVHKNSPRG